MVDSLAEPVTRRCHDDSPMSVTQEREEEIANELKRKKQHFYELMILSPKENIVQYCSL